LIDGALVMVGTGVCVLTLVTVSVAVETIAAAALSVVTTSVVTEGLASFVVGSAIRFLDELDGSVPSESRPVAAAEASDLYAVVVALSAPTAVVSTSSSPRPNRRLTTACISATVEEGVGGAMSDENSASRL
jgi:hypothetical protein